jgi:DNA replication and repair protein RecF
LLVRKLWLTDFRGYSSVEIELGPGTTAVLGANGEGKTNLVEAMSYLATLESFRGASSEALVRSGAEQAVVRAEVEHADGRILLIEAEISRQGRNRVLVNKQRLVRNRDLLGVLRVTVFSPDDLALVKGPPSERRRFLDDLLVALQPKRYKLLGDLDRILRQRASLLKQAGGRLTADIESTLDVWDLKLAEVGTEVGEARAELVDALAPFVRAGYLALAPEAAPPAMAYAPGWRAGGLAVALGNARTDDIRRQVTTVGPHRDELDLVVNGLPARTHASQGEQRSLALALRLGGHRLVTDRVQQTPLLVLDDVFSELDHARGAALLEALPPGQVVITSATELPANAHPDRVVRIEGGKVLS